MHSDGRACSCDMASRPPQRTLSPWPCRARSRMRSLGRLKQLPRPRPRRQTAHTSGCQSTEWQMHERKNREASSRDIRTSATKWEAPPFLARLSRYQIETTGNFLIRSADLFLRHGIDDMMADAAPAHPLSLNAGTRLSATHAAELHPSTTHTP